MDSETRVWTFQNLHLRFEPPDMFWAKFHGLLGLEDIQASVAIYREMSEARPFFFVAELEPSMRISPEAARYLSEELPTSWVRAHIYIGARLLHRAIARGLALAARLSRSGAEQAFEKIHHVSTEAEARAVIARLRAGKQARPPSP